MPEQIMSEVLDNRRVGEYHVLSLTAPGIAETARPGHFVTLAMGGEESSMVLRHSPFTRSHREVCTAEPWISRSPCKAAALRGWLPVAVTT